MIYWIDENGKGVREFVSLMQLEWAVPRHMQGHNRVFAIHPDENQNIHVDPETGRYIYISPIDGRVWRY